MFLSTNGGHTTVQKGLSDAKTHRNVRHCTQSRDTKCLYSTAEPSPYVCFSPSIEGESEMRKHILLSPKQILKFTRSGKTKPTHNGHYFEENVSYNFLRYHNAPLSSLL